MLALWGFLITGIWVGLITYEVNINRVNIIFYPYSCYVPMASIWQRQDGKSSCR